MPPTNLPIPERIQRRRTSALRRILAGAALSVIGVGLFAGTASAHVTPQDPEGPAGGYFTTAFKVSHGCDGSPTTKIEIKIPEGVTSVSPQSVAGWTLSSTTRKLDPPLESEGAKITETTDTVIWEGGSLPDHQLQMFWISMKLPEGKAGDKVAFPVIQTCQAGETDWIETASDGQPEPDHPAPVVTLTAASGDGHGSAAADRSDSAGAGETSTGTAAVETTSDDSNGNTLAIVGVVLGAVALILAGFGVVKASAKS